MSSILNKKKRREKITMLTAYDYPFAALLDAAGIDIILVGDSLAQVVLGLEETRDVNMEQMLHHARAVRRAVKKAFLVGDMPYSSYQQHPREALKNAQRFIQEAGCDAVKLEWFEHCPSVAEGIVKSGIPVMGHVGLTPQTADKLGGFKVQGQDALSAKAILANAKELERSGCFSVVLECIPDRLAEMITAKLKIPTIGIGAGPHCDGQVLVLHDVLGLCEGFHPKFVKPYVNLSPLITKAVKRYGDEVRLGKFPTRKYSYGMNKEELKKLIDNAS